MTTELEEIKRAENSPSLWKLHADSLVTLMEVAATLSESASRVVKEATESGKAGPERPLRFRYKAPPALRTDDQ